VRPMPVCKNPSFNPDDWFPDETTPLDRINEVRGRCLGCPVFNECETIPGEYGIFAGKVRRLCDSRY